MKAACPVREGGQGKRTKRKFDTAPLADPHWIDGGPTDLDNGALLCGRHHTVVHRDQLAGTLVDGQVLWDRRPGSYQRPATTPVA